MTATYLGGNGSCPRTDAVLGHRRRQQQETQKYSSQVYFHRNTCPGVLYKGYTATLIESVSVRSIFTRKRAIIPKSDEKT